MTPEGRQRAEGEMTREQISDSQKTLPTTSTAQIGNGGRVVSRTPGCAERTTLELHLLILRRVSLQWGQGDGTKLTSAHGLKIP